MSVIRRHCGSRSLEKSLMPGGTATLMPLVDAAWFLPATVPAATTAASRAATASIRSAWRMAASFLPLTNAGVKNAGDRHLPPVGEEVLTRLSDSCLADGKLEDDLDFSLRRA